MADLGAASGFLLREARLLERLRFANLFGDGDSRAVVAALGAYCNRDGGFGNALEPDLRCAASQPVGAHTAVEILAEVGSRPDHPLAEGVCGFLAGIMRDDGGLPFALPSAAEGPHAPWWRYTDSSSITESTANAAALHTLGIEHQLLEALTDFCWRAVESLEPASLEVGPGNAYDITFSFAFLNAVPDEPRAVAAIERLGPELLESDLLVTEGGGGELCTPLGLAPRPNSRSRRLFDPATISAELDSLDAGQLDDGGWDFPWPKWNPAAAHEWRGVVTVEALKTLAANGRL